MAHENSQFDYLACFFFLVFALITLFSLDHMFFRSKGLGLLDQAYNSDVVQNAGFVMYKTVKFISSILVFIFKSIMHVIVFIGMTPYFIKTLFVRSRKQFPKGFVSLSVKTNITYAGRLAGKVKGAFGTAFTIVGLFALVTGGFVATIITCSHLFPTTVFQNFVIFGFVAAAIITKALYKAQKHGMNNVSDGTKSSAIFMSPILLGSIIGAQEISTLGVVMLFSIFYVIIFTMCLMDEFTNKPSVQTKVPRA